MVADANNVNETMEIILRLRHSVNICLVPDLSLATSRIIKTDRPRSARTENRKVKENANEYCPTIFSPNFLAK
jgi:hypothetical protein